MKEEIKNNAKIIKNNTQITREDLENMLLI